MKVQCLLLIGAVAASIFAETVVKNSAPFSFPSTVGILGGHLLQNKDAIFVSSANLAGKKIITLFPCKQSADPSLLLLCLGRKLELFRSLRRRGTLIGIFPARQRSQMGSTSRPYPMDRSKKT